MNREQYSKLSKYIYRDSSPHLVMFWYLLAFLINPLFGIIVLAAVISFMPRSPDIYLHMFAIFVAVFLSTINATKVPEGDLLNYFAWFELAKEMTFVSYILSNMREPAYFSFIYIVSANQFFALDGVAFVYISTLIGYFAIFSALIKAGRVARLSSSSIISWLFFVAFFPPLFSNSAHLMRQFMAGAILLLFFARWIEIGRQSWLLLVLSIMVHSTAIIFVPIAFFVTHYSLSIGKLLIYGLLASIAIISVNALAGLFYSIPFLGYVVGRISQGSYQEHVSLSLLPLALAAFLLGLSLYKLYYPTLRSESLHKSGKVGLYISTCILSLSILFFHFTGETALSTRYLLYCYQLIGVAIIFAFKGVALSVFTFLTSYVIMPAAFVWTIENGVWTFAPIAEIVLISPLVILGNFLF